MKVLHLGKFGPPTEGGIELFSYDLLEYLNSKGVKADLLCFGDETKKDSYNGFYYFSCKTNIKLNSAPLSYDYVRLFKKIEKDYDIIHVHSPNPLAEMLALTTKKKLIIHWHSDIVKQKITYLFYKPFQQKVLKKADKIICTSPQYLKSSKQIEGFKEKAVVIPLGLNVNRLSKNNINDERYEQLKPFLTGKKVVLSVGRFVDYKGFEYSIDASKYLSDNIVLIIAGTGPLYNILKERVFNMNLNNKVYLPGFVQNISIFMKHCSLFCLPSVTRNEAFGLALAEALYFGKPLITTNVEGSEMSYVNKNGETGLIVEPKNPKALAEAINKILNDKELYNRFSINAKQRFEEFKIENIGDKIINLYKEVFSC